MPTVGQIITGLATEIVQIKSGEPLYRAAWSRHAVLPEKAPRPYRFGPPDSLRAADGTVPFWWLYLAPQPDTTVWEARFCLNDVTRPGTFYIDPAAERNGLIATLLFPRDLLLWNFNGEASSRLGIYDQLSSPDYDWCQEFGARVHAAISQVDAQSRPDGFMYPSRRVRGSAAIVLSSEAVASMRAQVTSQYERFVDHSVYERLRQHPLCVPPPLA
ncbi:RES family NAD+ phosphorylase [Paraburkholderia sp. CNPSo 3274]|uniref:RES family NAD+ phosphorylase n=1 Tax=Paraburkholderia sp. CNPSo 3274 TaxID=2940932 RepID=UPI0020B780C7|nr:RES family NAD+ phosphorylase [Paraburkholderia sp. CNPSo 3274]MCP3713195.1 RES family NAD+ phosphorylase [Paraburkholderia sp. CNPSo 3274]